MPTQDKTREPILVQNPITGRHVNVAPLFNAMLLFSASDQGSAADIKQAVSGAIRYVNLSGEGLEKERRNVSFDLYQLEDMFGAMMELSQ